MEHRARGDLTKLHQMFSADVLMPYMFTNKVYWRMYLCHLGMCLGSEKGAASWCLVGSAADAGGCSRAAHCRAAGLARGAFPLLLHLQQSPPHWPAQSKDGVEVLLQQ